MKIKELLQPCLFITLLMIIFSSCKENRTEVDKLGSFDISPNDGQIVYSYYQNGTSSLYIMNEDGTNPKMLFDSKGEVNYSDPKYSPDGKKIAFILYKKGSINSTLCISNSDGSNLSYLTDGNQIITEATFSLDGDNIFFCKANDYGSYSPIGRSDAHSFDIYSLNLKNKRETKLSNLKSYSIYYISDFSSNDILLYLYGGDKSGIYFYSKLDSSHLKQIVPTNKTVQNARLYNMPIYSDFLKAIGFTAPHMLYVMYLADMKAKLIYISNGPNFSKLAFSKNQKKIFFSLAGDCDLYSINVDGRGLRKLPIKIQKLESFAK